MFRLTQLFQSLIVTGNKAAAEKKNSAQEQSAKELTSVRLRPETKTYLQAQSEAFGVSLSQVINMILDGVVSMETKSINENKSKAIYDKVMTLFESHKINPVEMVKMLSNYNLKLSHISSADLFLDYVTDEMIKDISEWFSVDYEWIVGNTDKIYSPRVNTWYKSSYEFSLSVLEKSYNLTDFKVYAIKNSNVSFEQAEERNDNESRLDVGFVLSYKNEVNGVWYTKYEVCEFQNWNYWKCRGYLKYVFYFLDALGNRINTRAVSFSENVVDGLKSGRLLYSGVKYGEWDSWYVRTLVGDIKNNSAIEHSSDEYLLDFDNLISLIRDESCVYHIKYTNKDNLYGWRVKYRNDGAMIEAFYVDIKSGIKDIYSQVHKN
ncbi:hypothetical protein NOM73_06445 [Erwinia persicina]|uniref:hypothetical protein n=1 Tax=Erwinia persicina TaxID=55211 RepID=UPI0021094C7A|nr:hypothetical protein [Erwinia persicina]MCQ4094975.1 hypothetical protein [Erwinia persicina]MCQ4100060.1 hypothetical protein [Erwinia persicina]